MVEIWDNLQVGDVVRLKDVKVAALNFENGDESFTIDDPFHHEELAIDVEAIAEIISRKSDEPAIIDALRIENFELRSQLQSLRASLALAVDQLKEPKSGKILPA